MAQPARPCEPTPSIEEHAAMSDPEAEPTARRPMEQGDVKMEQAEPTAKEEADTESELSPGVEWNPVSSGAGAGCAERQGQAQQSSSSCSAQADTSAPKESSEAVTSAPQKNKLAAIAASYFVKRAMRVEALLRRQPLPVGPHPLPTQSARQTAGAPSVPTVGAATTVARPSRTTGIDPVGSPTYTAPAPSSDEFARPSRAPGLNAVRSPTKTAPAPSAVEFARPSRAPGLNAVGSPTKTAFASSSVELDRPSRAPGPDPDSSPTKTAPASSTDASRGPGNSGESPDAARQASSSPSCLDAGNASEKTLPATVASTDTGASASTVDAVEITGVALPQNGFLLSTALDWLRKANQRGRVKEEDMEDEPADGPKDLTPGHWQQLSTLSKGAWRFDPAQNPEALQTWKRAMVRLSVDDLLQTHDCVRSTFLNGPHRDEPVEGLTGKLLIGTASLDAITPLVVAKHLKKYWVVFGNRRLKALKGYRAVLHRPVFMLCIVHDLDQGSAPPAFVAKFISASSTRHQGLYAPFYDMGLGCSAKGKGKMKSRL